MPIKRFLKLWAARLVLSLSFLAKLLSKTLFPFVVAVVVVVGLSLLGWLGLGVIDVSLPLSSLLLKEGWMLMLLLLLWRPPSAMSLFPEKQVLVKYIFNSE